LRYFSIKILVFFLNLKVFLTSPNTAVNGTEINKSTFHGNRIHLKDSLLKSGEKNQMHILYVNDFNHDGAGFHQFIDPEDKQVHNDYF